MIIESMDGLIVDTVDVRVIHLGSRPHHQWSMVVVQMVVVVVVVVSWMVVLYPQSLSSRPPQVILYHRMG